MAVPRVPAAAAAQVPVVRAEAKQVANMVDQASGKFTVGDVRVVAQADMGSVGVNVGRGRTAAFVSSDSVPVKLTTGEFKVFLREGDDAFVVIQDPKTKAWHLGVVGPDTDNVTILSGPLELGAGSDTFTASAAGSTLGTYIKASMATLLPPTGVGSADEVALALGAATVDPARMPKTMAAE
jgi:hypothetical protein